MRYCAEKESGLEGSKTMEYRDKEFQSWSSLMSPVGGQWQGGRQVISQVTICLPACLVGTQVWISNSCGPWTIGRECGWMFLLTQPPLSLFLFSVRTCGLLPRSQPHSTSHCSHLPPSLESQHSWLVTAKSNIRLFFELHGKFIPALYCTEIKKSTFADLRWNINHLDPYNKQH